jgi:hypothetical protein
MKTNKLYKFVVLFVIAFMALTMSACTSRPVDSSFLTSDNGGASDLYDIAVNMCGESCK